jgi:hypothetical protein
LLVKSLLSNTIRLFAKKGGKIMEKDKVLQSGICAKCGKQAQGKTYKFNYGTEGGKVIGSSEAFLCSACTTRESRKIGLGILGAAFILAVLGFVIFKERTLSYWLPWVICLIPAALLILISLVGLLTTSGMKSSGYNLAVEVKRAEITNQNKEVDKFWDEDGGRKALERMKSGTIETCPCCKQEGVGQRYYFYYGWVIEDNVRFNPLTFLPMGSITYRVGGNSSAFICDRCVKLQGGGEIAALNVSRADCIKKYGPKTKFWTADEYTRLQMDQLFHRH